VCEIALTDENEFISFFDTNYNLFKDHLIVINGNPSVNIEEYLNEKELKFLFNVTLPKGKGRKAVDQEIQDQKNKLIAKQEELEAELSKLSDKVQNNLTVLDTLVRSGQELKIDGDLLLLNRVNSGASIYINGNLIITQIVEGSIRCNGNFMMLKASPKANIVFHDVEVDNSFLKERLNRVELKNNEIVITPVLKETNWVS
jgi:septum formation inhibitor MinC